MRRQIPRVLHLQQAGPGQLTLKNMVVDLFVWYQNCHCTSSGRNQCVYDRKNCIYAGVLDSNVATVCIYNLLGCVTNTMVIAEMA